MALWFRRKEITFVGACDSEMAVSMLAGGEGFGSVRNWRGDGPADYVRASDILHHLAVYLEGSGINLASTGIVRRTAIAESWGVGSF